MPLSSYKSRGASSNAILNKVKSYAREANAYSDQKMAQDYANGLISPKDYLEYAKKKQGGVSVGTTEYLSWQKKIDSIQKDIEEMPLSEGVKAGAVDPATYANWLSTNKLPGLDTTSPEYFATVNKIMGLSEDQVALDEKNMLGKYSQLKDIDPMAADNMRLKFYRDKVDRIDNPAKKELAINQFNNELQEANKRQIGYQVRDMERAIASMGNDTLAKAKYKYDAYSELETYALEQGLYDLADQMSIKRMNSETALALAIDRENEKADANEGRVLSQEDKSFKNFTEFLAMTGNGNPEGVKEAIINAYTKGFAWVDPRTGEIIQMAPRASAIQADLSRAERKGTALPQDKIDEMTFMNVVMNTADLGSLPKSMFSSEATMGGYNLNVPAMLKNVMGYAAGYYDLVYKGDEEQLRYDESGNPIKTSTKVFDFVDAEKTRNSGEYVQVKDRTFVKPSEAKTVTDPKTGEQRTLTDSEKIKIRGNKESQTVKTFSYGPRNFVVDPESPNKFLSYASDKESPYDVIRKNQELKSTQNKKIDFDLTGQFGIGRAFTNILPWNWDNFIGDAKAAFSPKTPAPSQPSQTQATPENIKKIEDTRAQAGLPQMAPAPAPTGPRKEAPSTLAPFSGPNPASNPVNLLTGGQGIKKSTPAPAPAAPKTGGVNFAEQGKKISITPGYYKQKKSDGGYDFFKEGFGAISIDDLIRENTQKGKVLNKADLLR